LVLVSGAPAARVSRLVDPAEPIEVVRPHGGYVSRGGEKLAAAIRVLGVEVAGRRCLDIGAATGGFTHCLLEHGAAHVVALDVGKGLLHERLRADARVTVVEGRNARHVALEELGGAPFDLVVVDVSFISLRLLVARLVEVLTRPGGELLALVKPQFEVGRAVASRGRGVVTDPVAQVEAVRRVASAFKQAGATPLGAVGSPLAGQKGNREAFLWFQIPARAQPR
jgi:23S rRNA (cytidine1920-2'-O)/16S rRNA (cytidine1409-2'-O)-methyltransferase